LQILIHTVIESHHFAEEQKVAGSGLEKSWISSWRRNGLLGREEMTSTFQKFLKRQITKA
jgi:hypothetical protein